VLWGKDALLRLPSDDTPIVKERMAVLVAKQPPKGRSVELSLFRRPTQNQHKHEQSSLRRAPSQSQPKIIRSGPGTTILLSDSIQPSGLITQYASLKSASQSGMLP